MFLGVLSAPTMALVNKTESSVYAEVADFIYHIRYRNEMRDVLLGRSVQEPEALAYATKALENADVRAAKRVIERAPKSVRENRDVLAALVGPFFFVF